jgi:hypothetical protein
MQLAADETLNNVCFPCFIYALIYTGGAGLLSLLPSSIDDFITTVAMKIF